MRTADFDYSLPESLIAQEAIEPRDAARLFHYDRTSNTRSHKQVVDFVDALHSDDILVLNTTKVFPARLFGHKRTGGQVEILLIHPTAEGHWRCMIRGKVNPGTEIIVAEQLITVIACHDNGERDIQIPDGLDIFAFSETHGHIPLPPYIKRADTEADKKRYQSVFAKETGSVAAPTASLHFTPELLERIKAKGVTIATVQLHVGPGTFKPVAEEDFTAYDIHAERCICTAETAALIQTAKANGQRVIAVGTTVVRTLETAARQAGGFAAYDGWSKLFLYPPQEMKIVDALLTNFHLPRSSLLMLVACLCGRETLLDLYQEAIAESYRFYSYGDAMFIS